MKLTHDGKRFVAITTFDERMIPKEARFRWDPADKKWWTDDVSRAEALKDYADPEAVAILNAAIEKRVETIEMSKATGTEVDIPVPEGLEYMPFQKAGIVYAINNTGTLIGDEMGLGKTIQAIGVINADKTIRRVLVICPASLRLNWQRELGKWLIEKREVAVVMATTPKEIFHQADIMVINFDILSKFSKELRAETWDLLVVDECHALKNPKALRTQQVVGKWDRNPDNRIEPIKARRRIFMTGTPIPNKPIELWTIAHTLDPKTFSNWKHFAERYCNAYQGSHGYDVSGASNLSELQEQLRGSIMVRRLKADVLKELPAKRRQVIELPMNGAAAAVKNENAVMDSNRARMEALKAAVELAKASEDAAEYENAVLMLSEATRIAFTDMAKVRYETAVAKIPYVIEHVRDCVESLGKVVLFAHHRDVVNAIKDEFGSEAVTLVGDTPMVERQAAVDRFQKDPNVKLFIGSIGAAGVGITLTASSHVVFAELDWVPGNVSQAEDRCHRIGQENSVTVQHLVLEGSLDAHIAKTIVRKQSVIDSALDKDIELMTMKIVPMVEDTATDTVSRKAVEREAVLLTEEQRLAIHLGLRMLSGMCDGARQQDGSGFSKIDTMIGKSLANANYLTPKQAALGNRLVTKYRGQLPEDLNEAVKGEKR